MTKISYSGDRAVTRFKPELSGIPETMLWTLYARAIEAKRSTGILRDPEAARIFDLIDYDFERSFGHPNVLFVVRAALIDSVLRKWLQRHPDGVVVSLGDGLETQAPSIFQRLSAPESYSWRRRNASVTCQRTLLTQSG
jgi:O-methyltransferase involved in polyketide biosynthesis